MNQQITLGVYITVTFKTPANRDELDFGALTLTHSSGRTYLLDVNQSWSEEDDTKVELRASEDFDTFPQDDEFPYDLTLDDIKSGDIKATLFIGGEEEEPEVESITYNVEDGEGNTIAENLTAEQE